MSTKRDTSAAGFWQWFVGHHGELLDIVHRRREGRVTDLLDHALRANDLNLAYDVIESEKGAELTFTPEGDEGKVARIERIVASAPKIEGWTFHARRQRKTLEAALAFVRALHGFDLSGARMSIATREDGRFDLTFIHEQLAQMDEQRYAVVGTFLDHALGEEVTMSFIGDIDFKPTGDGIVMSLLINELISEASEVSATADISQRVELQ